MVMPVEPFVATGTFITSNCRSRFVTERPGHRASWKLKASKKRDLQPVTTFKFDQPVSVVMGLGFPRDVESVRGAYDVLLEWNGIPDFDYQAALDVCRKALKGDRSAQQARDAFRRFASNRRILSEED
jgi:hypothetical protein